MLCLKKHQVLVFHHLCWIRMSLLLTTFYSLAYPLRAQETFVPPASKFITSFPFSVFTGGVMIVKARLDNFPDSLNFVLDTGSGGISLDSLTCERLKLSPQPSEK